MGEYDLKRLEVAIQYINRMVSGRNPVTNRPAPENEILINPNVNRCLQFVSEILTDVKSAGGIVGKTQKSARTARRSKVTIAETFPYEILQGFRYQTDQQISYFLKQLEELLPEGESLKVRATLITDWLRGNGYLQKSFMKDISKETTIPTSKGEELGIYSERAGVFPNEYYRIFYNEKAQLFLIENFRRIAVFFDTSADHIVCAQQTHTKNVRIVTSGDAGKGVTKERDYTDVDGLITDVPGLILYTSHADCVPIYFYDPVRRVIALAHSGWKGTVARIGEVTVRRMQDIYGCRPDDIYAAVGPSICADCYEVSEDVAEEVRKCFGAGSPSEAEPSDSAGTIPRILARGRRPGKYQLDLWRACERILLEAGIIPEHLTITNLCTCENSTELFSHRATDGKRGNQGAFLMLE